MARKPKSKPGPYLLQLRLLRERIPDANRFPYTLPVVRHLDTLAFHPKVTFFIGENGTGKSTLLEAIAVACGLNPEGGSRNFNFATRASHSSLDECLRLSRTLALPGDSYFLRAESFYNVASEIERLDKEPGGPPIIRAYGGRSLRGGQFVIATHSPIIMAYPDARIYLLEVDGIREVAYTDTEYYLVTRGFLSNPQRSLRALLADEQPTSQGADPK